MIVKIGQCWKSGSDPRRFAKFLFNFHETKRLDIFKTMRSRKLEIRNRTIKICDRTIEILDRTIKICDRTIKFLTGRLKPFLFTKLLSEDSEQDKS
jgi:hypothetical protein